MDPQRGAEDGDLRRIDQEISSEALLRLSAWTLYTGDVHAKAGLILQEGTQITGDVYTDGPIEMADEAHIRGRIHASDASLDDRSWPMVEGGRQREGDLDELTEAVSQGTDEATKGRPWSPSEVRDGLFARLLAPSLGLRVEKADARSFVVSADPGARPPGSAPVASAEELERVVREVGQTARPGLQVHPLTSARTAEEMQLLVRL